MKKIITLLFLFFAVIANAAKYYEAKIEFNNGDVKKGYAILPSNYDRVIYFRETEKGKNERYNSNLIDKITYYTDSGNEVIFIRTNLRGIRKSKKGIKEKVKKKKQWHVMAFSSDYISMYYLGHGYDIDENNNRIIKKANNDLSLILLSLKRPNEKPVTVITADSGTRFVVSEKSYLNSLIAYFEDVPELVERIENNEFRGGYFKQILEAYTEYKKKTEEAGAVQE